MRDRLDAAGPLRRGCLIGAVAAALGFAAVAVVVTIPAATADVWVAATAFVLGVAGSLGYLHGDWGAARGPLYGYLVVATPLWLAGRADVDGNGGGLFLAMLFVLMAAVVPTGLALSVLLPAAPARYVGGGWLVGVALGTVAAGAVLVAISSLPVGERADWLYPVAGLAWFAAGTVGYSVGLSFGIDTWEGYAGRPPLARIAIELGVVLWTAVLLADVTLTPALPEPSGAALALVVGTWLLLPAGFLGELYRDGVTLRRVVCLVASVVPVLNVATSLYYLIATD